MIKLLLCLSIVAAASSCGSPVGKKISPAEMQNIRSSINQNRAEKDSYFVSAESPLTDSLKAQFHGLDYYPFDSAYVFEAILQRYDNPRELDMITSKGKAKHYIEYGFVEFDLNGKQKLNAYRPKPALEGHADYLFIPFKDITNGKETYGSGRYMELTLNDSIDHYIFDFNSAYSPWCAYSDNYNCPYPPKENHLSVPVLAGEKKFSLRSH